ncbi:hypothetical protein COB64_04265 [Candidatus Wolfebacteria bacterium]|nr:MAG: hypothetical protein COB64_04265 [Candidatus Wolfebacteria bacterium]
MEKEGSIFEKKKDLLDTILRLITEPDSMTRIKENVFVEFNPRSNTLTKWKRLARIIDRFLAHELLKIPDHCLYVHNVKVQIKEDESPEEVDKFLLGGEYRGIRLRKNFRIGRYSNLFISSSTIQHPFGYVYGDKSEYRGDYVWEILALFLNAFGMKNRGFEDWVNGAIEVPRRLEPGSKEALFNDLYTEITIRANNNPFWKLHVVRIQEILANIYTASLNGDKINLTILGSGGTAKTYFIGKLLRGYMESLQVIKIAKLKYINQKLFRNAKSAGVSASDALDEVQKRCLTEGGLLLVDNIFPDFYHFKITMDLVRKVLDSDTYPDTSVILMGHSLQMKKVKDLYILHTDFPLKFVLNFMVPSMNMHVKMFERYTIRADNYSLSNDAKATIKRFFVRLEKLKDFREVLHNIDNSNLDEVNNISYPYEMRRFRNMSEFSYIYLSIKRHIAKIDEESTSLSDRDPHCIEASYITECDVFKSTFADLERLIKIYPQYI